MVTFGIAPESEGQWFSEAILEGSGVSILARGMKKAVIECWEHFKHVSLDRIQAPLLMALVTFNPGKFCSVLFVYSTCHQKGKLTLLTGRGALVFIGGYHA